MILAIDIGNTNIVLGVYDNKDLKGSWRISTDKNKTSDELGMLMKSLLINENIEILQLESIIVSSVVPSIMYSIENAIKKFFKKQAILIDVNSKSGLKIKIDNPSELGADRLVNAVGAVSKYGIPLIIIDFGTATTFCAINSKKEYIGGAICPGIKISAEALFLSAAKLSNVELAKPKTVIGSNTVTNVQSGIIYGQVGLVDYLIKRMKLEMNEKTEIKVIATGGLANLIASESETINEVNTLLTLEGLRLLYDMNKEV